MNAEAMAENVAMAEDMAIARHLAKRVGDRNLNPLFVSASCWLLYAICKRLGLQGPCLAWLGERRPEMADEIRESLNSVN